MRLEAVFVLRLRTLIGERFKLKPLYRRWTAASGQNDNKSLHLPELRGIVRAAASAMERSGNVKVNGRTFRRALGQFATGVTVVTGATARGGPVGVTVNAFASLSLKPPLVLVCLRRAMRGLSAFVEGDHFAVNMLSERQQRLSRRFASGRFDRRFKGVAWTRGANGCPILGDCLAVLECSRVAIHDGGDHVIVVGRVQKLHYARRGHPLLYFRGHYGRFTTG